MARADDVDSRACAACASHYGKVVALDGVDLALRGGQVLALLGANGAGKTTAIALLLGPAAAPMRAKSSCSARSPQRHRRAPPHRRDAAVRRHCRQHCKVRRTAPTSPRSYYPQPRSVDGLRGAGRARRPAAAPLRQAVRRPAAPRAVRAGAVRATAIAVPRRTHHRPGHRGAADAVARDPRTGRRRLLRCC